MSEIISFKQAKQDRQPHWQGACKCTGCGHEWQGVAPIGTMWVDCPSCGFPKGHPKYPFGAAVGDLLFVCDCGSEAMTAFKRKGRFRIMCMGCGTDQTGAIFG